VFVLCKVGSRFESRSVNGISHFVEHLMFKGTTKRPNTLSISRLLDGVGAEYNAFTSKDHTGYYVKINSDHLHLALDVVADMLYHSKFDPKEIDRERKVIIEEINMYEDNPLMYIEDIFEQELFAGHPLGQLIAGPREVIRSVSRQTIVDFVQRHYFPTNMMVVVSGRFDESTILSDIAKQFSAPISRRRPLALNPFRPKASGPRLRVMEKDTEQAQIGLGYPAFSYGDRRLPALSLLSTILGGNMSSRLFISIRERKGLAYAVRCSPSVYEDTGALYIQAGVAKARTEEAIKAILAELDQLALKGVSAVELKRAKEYTNGKLVLELEDSESLGAWFGKQWLLMNKLETPAEKMLKLRSVTREDVRAVARSIFKRAQLTVAVIGPYKDAKPFRKLLG
jgi:predicted Zn-dependent peptidase